MKNQAKWIWNYGDFEIYHAMKQNLRREEYGYYPTPLWRVDVPRPTARLYKTATINKPETVTLYTNGRGRITVRSRDASAKNAPYTSAYAKFGETIRLAPGEIFLTADMEKEGGFPCLYAEGETFASDESWFCASFSAEEDLHAGTSDFFKEKTDNPEIFPFSYERIEPVSSERVGKGTLYDFGKETYGLIHIDAIKPTDGRSVPVQYGESRSEALDLLQPVPLRDTLKRTEESAVFPKRAFRYFYVTDDTDFTCTVSCNYEYLPLEIKGAFRCEEDVINRIWQTSAYTLRLNTREAFLDGIKRDGWLWSGDAYQSFFVNYYLYFDRDIVRRTLLGLRGSEPTTMHINTIPDYSFYWLCSVYDYYYHTGDRAFVASVFPKMKSLLAFAETNCDADGFYRRAKGDWIFIDWADTAKSGIVCALQMLLVCAYRSMASCAALLGESGEEYARKADSLKEKINALFWREDLGAFVDCIGREDRVDVVTRHANIFALLFRLTDEERIKKIKKCVIDNPAVPPITTPYFEFFELDALCSLGDLDSMMQKLRSYWGGMLSLGATTVWEQFDPERRGDEHYEMYGHPYGCSLCHAWGASPIYLLGRYVLGVSPTSPAYETFEIKPCAAGLKNVSGRVPLPDGYVDVSVKEGNVTVYSSSAGGTLVIGGKRIPVEKGVSLTYKA